MVIYDWQRFGSHQFLIFCLEVDYFSKPTEVEEDLGSNSLEALVPVDFALNLTKW